jgi:predicted  nucleic acid-binding Zn-ribbon protein
VRSADRVQDAKGQVEEHEEHVQQLREEQAPKREELSAKLAELDERLEAARAERRDVAKNVEADLQERYDRIRRGRAPLALYPLRNGACGHCFTAVPLHRRQKLQDGSGLEACEACGVLVYDEGA